MKAKQINEMNSAAGGAIQGAPFTKKVMRRKSRNISAPFTQVQEKIVHGTVKDTGVAAVYNKKNKKTDKKDSNYKLAKFESKSESMLREAIRNLVFLNRIKYHEEQARKGIEEQKLRKIIRHLLSEAKSEQVFLTTGENNAADFINNITSTTFDQLYAKLSSSEEQRLAFRTTYLEKLKLYLDSLDQQHVILNPDDKPTQQTSMEKPGEGNEPSSNELPTMPPDEAPPPEEVGGGMGQETAPESPEMEAPVPELTEATAPTVVPASGINTVSDTSRLQKQVIATPINRSDLHPTGVSKALSALTKDLPQIDSLYSQLTFKPLKMPSGEITSDREIFRKMLFGGPSQDGSSVSGNLDINFDRKDKDVVTSDKPSAQPAAPEPSPVPTGTSPGSPTPVGQPGV